MQAALKKSNLELEAELKVKLNNIEMLSEGAQMKDKIIKVILSALSLPENHITVKFSGLRLILEVKVLCLQYSEAMRKRS